MEQELKDFVKEAKAKGIENAKIAAALKAAGWPHDDVKDALGAYADTDFPIPVPRRRPYLSAREAFHYLTLFLCLYISAFSVGTLAFEGIDRVIADPLNPYGNGSASTVRLALSALVVAGPVFAFLSWSAERAARRDPTKRASKVRKWLTYVTLFTAGAAGIVDLIALINGFLEGDMSARFALKALTVLAITGGTLLYYLLDLRREEKDA